MAALVVSLAPRRGESQSPPVIDAARCATPQQLVTGPGIDSAYAELSFVVHARDATYLLGHPAVLWRGGRASADGFGLRVDARGAVAPVSRRLGPDAPAPSQAIFGLAHGVPVRASLWTAEDTTASGGRGPEFTDVRVVAGDADRARPITVGTLRHTGWWTPDHAALVGAFATRGRVAVFATESEARGNFPRTLTALIGDLAGRTPARRVTMALTGDSSYFLPRVSAVAVPDGWLVLSPGTRSFHLDSTLFVGFVPERGGSAVLHAVRSLPDSPGALRAVHVAGEIVVVWRSMPSRDSGRTGLYLSIATPPARRGAPLAAWRWRHQRLGAAGGGTPSLFVAPGGTVSVAVEDRGEARVVTRTAAGLVTWTLPSPRTAVQHAALLPAPGDSIRVLETVADRFGAFPSLAVRTVSLGCVRRGVRTDDARAP